jgi:hypothetical protein
MDTIVSGDHPSIFRVEDGSSTVLQNIGIHPPYYMGARTQKVTNSVFTTVRTSILAAFLVC